MEEGAKDFLGAETYAERKTPLITSGVLGIRCLWVFPFSSSLPNSDHFEILGFDRRCSVGRGVMFRPQLLEFRSQGGVFLSIQCTERLIGRSVVSTEELDDLRGREGIAKRI